MNKYKTINPYEEEEHPWDFYIPNGAKNLILGTFPTSKKNRINQVDYYYPNPNNLFWKVLCKLCPSGRYTDKHILNKEERISVLDKLNVGIADMGNRVFRHSESSSDNNLFVIEYTDILTILDNHLSINTLILTSSSGSNSVEGWLRYYLDLNDIYVPKLKGKNPKKGYFDFKGRKIDLITVHSTSRTAAKSIEELEKMYKNILS